MNDRQWDEQLRRFVKTTGEEIRRVGEDIKTEAERLLVEVRDPDKQRKVKEGLRDFSVWARKTAEEVVEVVEKGIKKAEGALNKNAKGGSERERAPARPAAANEAEATGSATSPAPSSERSAPPRKSAAKTVGPKKSKSTKAAPKTRAAKTVGRKKG